MLNFFFELVFFPECFFEHSKTHSRYFGTFMPPPPVFFWISLFSNHRLKHRYNSSPDWRVGDWWWCSSRVWQMNIQDNHCWLLSLYSKSWLQHERLPHTDIYLLMGVLLDCTLFDTILSWCSTIQCVYHLLAADKSSILGGATSHMSDLARGQQRQQKWIHKPRAERPPDPHPAVILCKIVLIIFSHLIQFTDDFKRSP